MPQNGRISGFYIMHVPGFDAERDENVAHLQQELLDVAPVSVVKDKRRAGVLFTYRRALHAAIEGLEDDCDWIVIMQDDSRPIGSDWASEMEAALENSPHPFVSMCHFSDHGLKRAQKGQAYGEHINAVWGQAVAYRRDILEQYWQLVDAVFELDPFLYSKWDDGLLAVYNILQGTKSCITSRAIFTHLDVRSTMNHVPGKHRHPACTIADPEFKNLEWKAGSVGKISIGIDARVPELAERMSNLHA